MHRTLSLILLLSPLLGSCYTTSATYSGEQKVADSSVSYLDPGFETSVSSVGWGVVVVATAGGAYAGYRSGLPASEKPVVNAMLFGATTGLSTLILNSLLKPEAPDYREEQASLWLQKLDERLLLVEQGPRIVRSINPAMEEVMIPRDTAALTLFARLFPKSLRIDEIVRQSAAMYERDSLPGLVTFIADRAERDGSNSWMKEARIEASRRYIEESPDLATTLAAVDLYPDLSPLAEARAALFVESSDDLLQFTAAFGSSDALLPLVEQILPHLAIRQIDSLLITAKNQPALLRLVTARIDSARTVGGLLDLAERFPAARSHAEKSAAAIATSPGDLRRFLTAFPNSSYADTIRAGLLERLRIPEALGTSINTSASEYAPVISPDGTRLYFTRRGTSMNKGGSDDEDIWVSDLLPWGSWSSAGNLDELNDWTSNSVNSVTPDGNTLLLHGAYATRDFASSPASISHREADGWSTPRSIEIEGYYNLGLYMQSFLANDGQTLLLALERRRGRGKHDLYVSFLKDDGTWSAPKNLGRAINTAHVEDAPFLASDGRTLYFASDGRGGEGGSDLFMARRLDDSWTRWSKPVNLGPPINTPKDDSFFFIPASGDVAYFSSDRTGQGSSDIFRVALPEDRQPLPVVLVSGIARDRTTGEPIAATIIYEDLTSGREIGRARTDATSGRYKITLPPGTNYGFRAEAADHLAISDNLDLSALRVYREQEQDLELVPIRAGAMVRLNNLFFDFGKATLRRESHAELQRLAAIMNERSAMKIEIIGHTDSIGIASDNLGLSRARSASVARYLVGLGIATSRLTTHGRGEEAPVAPNGTDKGRAMNRRVEVRVVGVGG